MQRFWHKAYDAEALRTLYGDATSNVLVSTIERGKLLHAKAIALAMLGDRPGRDLAPLIAGELFDEYPLVREFAAMAFSRAIGPCSLSLYAGTDRLMADAEGCSKKQAPIPTWSSRLGATPATAEPAED